MVSKKFPQSVGANPEIGESPLYLLDHPNALIDWIESRKDKNELLIADSGMNLRMPKKDGPMRAFRSAHVFPLDFP